MPTARSSVVLWYIFRICNGVDNGICGRALYLEDDVFHWEEEGCAQDPPGTQEEDGAGGIRAGAEKEGGETCA